MAKMNLDKEQIRELAALLEETGLAEIEVAEGDRRLHLVRHQAPVLGPIAAAPAAFATPGHAGAASDTAEAAEAYGNHPGAVTSPMVGTAYRAPEPGASAFVNVGDRVAKGDTLLIIEAMKTFNEIPAPREGVIAKILVENGAPVEYGDVLMLIE